MKYLHLANWSRHLASRGHLLRILRVLRLALPLHRQRKLLAKLDDRTLQDIGISRSEALAEAKRPVWDVPPTWLR
ncbi:MAG: DUF1127 domain-containing protein [Rhodobacter sp.]|nr:DUF1127 domain-containing protein [Rhodobacter sp.]